MSSNPKELPTNKTPRHRRNKGVAKTEKGKGTGSSGVFSEWSGRFEQSIASWCLGTWVVQGPSRAVAKTHDRSAPTAPLRRGIGKVQDEGMRGQNGSDDGALGPGPAPVDQANFVQALLHARGQILADEVGDVPGGEGVEIQRVLDRHDDGSVLWLRAIGRLPGLAGVSLG